MIFKCCQYDYNLASETWKLLTGKEEFTKAREVFTKKDENQGRMDDDKDAVIEDRKLEQNNNELIAKKQRIREQARGTVQN